MNTASERWIFRLLYMLLVAAAAIYLVLFARMALAIPLETYQDFVATGPRSDAQRVGNAAILARGSGTRNFYFLEVDPTTGALPVNVIAGGGSNPSVGTNGGPIPASSTLVGASNAGILTPLAMDYGASSSALRTASQIGNTTGQADFNVGAAGPQTLRTALASGSTVSATQGTTPWVVDGSGVVQPVSGTVTANQGTSPWVIGDGAGAITVDGTVTSLQGTSPWVISDGAGALTIDGTVTALQGTTPWIVNGSGFTQPVSGTVTANQGTNPWTVTGVVAVDTIVTSSSQAKSNTACAALGAAYTTLLTLTFNACILHVFNGCDGTWILSIDSGATDYLDLAAGESTVIDFCANGRHIGSTTTIQAKDGTSPPTTGTLRLSVAG